MSAIIKREDNASAIERVKHGPTPRHAMDRFMEKLSITEDSECWLWTAGKSACGYGRFGLGGHFGIMHPAHRISWQMFRGEIPEGMEVAHKCDVRLCVNPAHLWLATHAENMADMVRKGRHGYGISAGRKNGNHRSRRAS